jgi:CubicO group peptidase (beta-lactamase class C family)
MKIRLCWLSLLCLSVLNSSSLSTQAALHSNNYNFTAIDNYITFQMQSDHIPGLALGIVQGSSLLHLHGFGSADSVGKAVTPYTPFIMGSISKSFTALATLQLVEQGRLALDTPVQHYLSWFNVGHSPDSSKITIRNLLNQVSGIPTYAGGKSLAGDGRETLEQRVRELSVVPLTTPVGKTFQYSEDNYIVLGFIIQVVSGQTYEQYIQDHIFSPLNMKHSFVSQLDAQHESMATGYSWWFGTPLPAHTPYPKDALPASFVISSVEDMTHYLIAQLNNGSYANTSILSPNGIEELHKPVAPIGTGDSYAMGWVVGSRHGQEVIWHGGDVANFHGDMIILPEKHLGIILLDNANNALIQLQELGKIGRIAAGVTSLLLGLQPSDDVLSVHTFYWIFDAIALILLAVQVWSLVGVFRKWNIKPQLHSQKQIQFTFSTVLPLLWELGLSLCILIALSITLRYFDVPLSLLFLYSPDFSYWLTFLLLLLIGTGILRSIFIFRLRNLSVSMYNIKE